MKKEEKKQKNILFLTGTRADFGKMEPLATKLFISGYHITYFITGMHMMKQYGLTKHEVLRSSYNEVFEFVNQRSGDSQDIILSKTILGFSDFLNEHEQDLVVFHGDRVEAFACAIVAATNYVKCAHIEGGEVSGTIDELFRHAITKLSMSHFVSSKIAKERVKKMGEDKKRIYVIGSPELDRHSESNSVKIDEVKKRYAINFDEYAICIFHPVTSEPKKTAVNARALFNTLVETGKNYVIILPNNDPGTDEIINVIKTLKGNNFRVLPSMRFLYFSQLMKNSRLIIGNSSIGVREAPFLGIPSINIGTRQNNRSKSKSILNLLNVNKKNLMESINKLWHKNFDSDSSFGEGNSADLFEDILSSTDFWDTPFQKYFIEN